MAGAGEQGEETVEEATGLDPDQVVAVDELHLVYTRFQNMVTQIPAARRMAPLQVEYADQDEVTGEREHEGEEQRTVPEDGVHRLYEFEPDADDAVRRAAAEVHRRPPVRGPARVGGLGVGEPAARDEGRDRQCERVDP